MNDKYNFGKTLFNYKKNFLFVLIFSLIFFSNSLIATPKINPVKNSKFFSKKHLLGCGGIFLLSSCFIGYELFLRGFFDKHENNSAKKMYLCYHKGYEFPSINISWVKGEVIDSCVQKDELPFPDDAICPSFSSLSKETTAYVVGEETDELKAKV